MNKRATKREEEARKLLEDFRGALGPEYRIVGDPTSVFADVYRDIDGRHDIEVLNYVLNRTGTKTVQVSLWLLPAGGVGYTALVNVRDVPGDPAIVRTVANRLARLAGDANVDNMRVVCSYGQLDEVLGRAAS